uniref:C-mannosyltransferase DPY19L1 n=1 Tax=Macrostomum lignano TaxID=282301 RepID=A0A1I8GSX8_9PLAT
PAMSARQRRKQQQPKLQQHHEVKPDKTEQASSGSGFLSWRSSFALTCLVAIAAGYFTYRMNSRMWENHIHFSHLATIEREMFLTSELGFYYSFFKQVVEAPTLFDGVRLLLSDTLSEHPDTINALRRFNLYPELCIGAMYRVYAGLAQQFGWHTRDCYQVNRGSDMPPVQSCEGIGEPMYFYVEVVYLLSGLTAAGLALLASYARPEDRPCPLSGVIATVGYLGNHRECTRVQWTPTLRESFSFPLLVLHQICLLNFLRRGGTEERPKSVAVLLLAGSALLFLLPWQFAQFALLVEAGALLCAHALGYLGHRLTRLAMLALLLALALAFALQFGNVMLVSSLLCSALLTALPLLQLHQLISRLAPMCIAAPALPVLWLCCTLLAKAGLAWLLGAEQDSHMWDILLSKLSAGRTFHSMMYTCAKEFDFYDPQSLIELSKTLALPAGLASLAYVCYRVAALVIARSRQYRARLVLGRPEPPVCVPAESPGVDAASLVYWIRDSTKPGESFAGTMPVTATVRLVADRPIVNHPHYEDAGMRARTKQVYSMYSHLSLADWSRTAKSLSVNYTLLVKGYCRRGPCSMPDIFERTEAQNPDSPVLCELMASRPDQLRPHLMRVFDNPKYSVFRVVY